MHAQATLWLAEAYARSPQVVSDILAVQRASGFMKQASVTHPRLSLSS